MELSTMEGETPKVDEMKRTICTTVPASTHRLLRQLGVQLDVPNAEVLDRALRALAAQTT